MLKFQRQILNIEVFQEHTVVLHKPTLCDKIKLPIFAY